MKKSIDWGGKWFDIRVSKGESDLVTFQYIDGLTQTRIRRDFHHRDTDGYGAMMLTLEKEGYSQLQPPSRSMPLPSFLRRLGFLIKGLLSYPKPPKVIWKNWKPQQPFEEQDVAWLSFTAEMEERLLTQSKKLKINPTSYLLAVLSTISRQELCHPSMEPGLWVMPVNMRGAFPNWPLSQNCVSFVPLRTEPKEVEATACSIYYQLRTALKENWHWAFWEVSQIGRWIGYSGMKLLASGSDQSYWTGTFSDLGTWDDESLKHDPIAKRTWIIAPAGSANYPLGATSIKWFGQRVVTVKVHPSITPEHLSSTAMAQKIVQRMKNHFQKDLRKPIEAWKSSDNRNSLPLEP